MNLFEIGAILAVLGAVAIGVLGARAPELRPWGIRVALLGGLLFLIQAARSTPLFGEGANSGNLGAWIAAFLTLAIFSFLYKDNPFYRFAEHLFVGVGSGYYITIYWWNTLKPNLSDEVVLGWRALWFGPRLAALDGNGDGLLCGGEASAAGKAMEALLAWGDHSGDGCLGPGEWGLGAALAGPEPGLRMLVPLVLGIFIMLLFVAPKHGWLSRISFAWYIGVASGFAIPTTLVTRVLRQGQGAFRDFCAASADCVAGVQAADPGTTLAAVNLVATRAEAAALAAASEPGQWEVSFWINAVLLLVGTLSALAYFFFSLPSKGGLKVLNRVGIIFLMISFGASFGYTVMARISILIGRFQFLLGDWLGVGAG